MKPTLFLLDLVDPILKAVNLRQIDRGIIQMRYRIEMNANAYNI
jgi:hypothetical protein